MTEMARKRDSNMKANNVDYGWTLQGAFSVDLDPTRGGEHVYADYVMNYDDGEQNGGVNAELRFYIIDGKIVTVNQFNQGIIMEEEKKYEDQAQLQEEDVTENQETNETDVDENSDTNDDEIQKLKEEIESLKDQRLRAVAELENFRKRAEKDQSDALKYGIANFAKEIINIGDNIERAKSSISEEVRSNESIKSVVDGLDLIAQSTMATFEKIGIKKIESINQKFDHNLHQAMMEIEKNDCEPGTIVQELIPGYTLHDRLLRPAMVGVSKKSQENQDDKAIKEEEKSEK